jgi:putative ABC transport system ATP-binding protein
MGGRLLLNDALLSTVNVCRYYDRGSQTVKAVDGVSLSVNSGELLVVVGASGSGKSTLLNLMAGLDSPTSGRIVVEHQNLGDMSRKELAAFRARLVGVVFQSFHLLPQYTALKNVELPLYFTNVRPSERERRARDILDRLGLSDRLDHRPADLSGGEQQRVALARALVKEPHILFADEPTGNLDRENSRAIADLLTGLNRDGLTTIVVSHDVELAERIGGRTIRMNYGRVVS